MSNQINPGVKENRRTTHDGYSPVVQSHRPIAQSLEERGYKPAAAGSQTSTPPPPPISGTNVSKPAKSGK